MKKTASILNLDNLPWETSFPSHIIFDIDGTLTDQDSYTSPQTFQALRDLTAAGIKVILATGRTFPSSQRFLEKAAIPPRLVCSGGSIVWNGSEVKAKYHPQAQTEEAIEYGKSRGLTIILETIESLLIDATAPYIPPLLHNASEGIPLNRVDLRKVNHQDVVKVTLCGTKELIDASLAEINQLFPGTVRGHDSFVDFPPLGISKWTGIQEILQAENLSADTGIGIGDSGNDVPWLPHMGCAIAAPHSVPDLLALVDWQLPTSPQHITDFTAALLRHRAAL